MAASPLGVPIDLVVVTAPARQGWGTTLGRFIHRKPLGAAGGAIMLVMLVTAVLAPWLQTHDPIAPDATYPLGRPNPEHRPAPPPPPPPTHSPPPHPPSAPPSLRPPTT